jgi:hypothetical protein
MGAPSCLLDAASRNTTLKSDAVTPFPPAVAGEAVAPGERAALRVDPRFILEAVA